jgi:hypothetical protein
MANPDTGEHGEREVTIKVHNEDSGRILSLKGDRDRLVRFFVEEMYKDLKAVRKPDDRLRCEGNGQDVFPFEHLNIVEYSKKHCSTHEWLFASGTGGAECSAHR